MTSQPMPSPSFDDASRTARQGLVGELLGFMAENAKWWLIPFLLVFGMLGGVLALGATGAAPFIYVLS